MKLDWGVEVNCIDHLKIAGRQSKFKVFQTWLILTHWCSIFQKIINSILPSFNSIIENDRVCIKQYVVWNIRYYAMYYDLFRV